jgi:hypothetical protein
MQLLSSHFRHHLIVLRLSCAIQALGLALKTIRQIIAAISNGRRLLLKEIRRQKLKKPPNLATIWQP